jgi:RNA polymerase sigma factor (sigma-70 family)
MQEVLEDKYLVNAVLAGNKEVFIKLIRQYQGLVLHIVTPLIGVNEDREDICQDVFLKVYEKLDTFEFRSKLGTWIGNIAYNTSINFLKKKRNVLLSDILGTGSDELFLENIEDEHNNPEKLIVEKEQISQLKNLINMLPEIQKSVLLLFYHDEQGLDEISSILEMPVNTIKSHLFRARNTLKQIMPKNKTI